MTNDSRQCAFREIRPVASRKSMLLGAPALGLLLLGGISCSNKAPGKQVEAATPASPIPVQVAQAELRELRRTVDSVGSLFPYEEVTVSSEVEGKVEEVLVDVGDYVTQGQSLVKVSQVEFRLALEQQRAALQQALARLGLPKEGDDLRDVRDAAEVKKAAADLNDAEIKYKRTKSLLDRGLMPRETYDEAESKYKAARAAYDLSIQTVQNLRAQVSQYRAQMALAQKKLDDCSIRAPFAGQIKDRPVTLGQYLRVQTPVMVIVNVDPLRVRLKVPEKMAGWIKKGQTATIKVEAYPDRTFSGKIWRMNPTVDQQTRSFEAEALVANNEGLLKPGFFVKASIPSDRVDQVLFVPQRSLVYAYGIYKVYVVEGNVLNEKEVRVGERPNQDVEIIDGLVKGQSVALPVRGAALRDRAAIEIVQ